MFKKTKTIITTAVCVLLPICTNAEVQDIYVGKHNRTMYDINTHFLVDSYTPVYGKPVLISRHMGDQLKTVPTWDVSTYTGFSPVVTDATTSTAGMDGSVASGPNAAQVYGESVGLMLNSWSFQKKEVIGGGPHYIWSYMWNHKAPEAPTPWKLWDSDLTLQVKMKMPYMRRWGDSVGQLSFVVYAADMVNKKPLVFVVNLHDPRGMYDEGIGNDGNPFVSSPLSDGMRYVTKSKFSASQKKTTFGETFFRAHITRDNLTNAAKDLNDLNGTPYLSENPEDYKIASVNILMEVFTPNDSQISMGVSFKKFMVMSCGGLDCTL